MRRLIFLLALPLYSQGLFEGAADVGTVEHKGAVQFDSATRAYRITGSGANMWLRADAFHFAYRRADADVTITTDIEWRTEGGNGHKKAGPILRAGLDADDVYASMIAHGDGTLGFQFRRTKGGITEEIKTPVRAPVTLRLSRHGGVISAEAAPKGGTFRQIGSLTIELPQAVYAGLAVCSHDASRSETAEFRNVGIRTYPAAARRVVESTLETLDVQTGERRIVYRAQQHFEAPNWPRRNMLFFNGGGDIYRVPPAGGVPERLDTGDVRVNNDHGISPDGKWMAISGRVGNTGQSQVWLVPITGGTPKLVTKLSPSYWHGWSPDGKTLAYCANRNGNFDIYTIPVEGGEETRLTTADGLDDGPEYSPDGQTIYFNSERNGLMRIWRMRADGTGQEMVSEGAESADWFAHPSPDGKWIVYISYDKSVKGHPPNKDVVLKLAPASGGPAKVIATLFGGQGTMNVPSWSPDSRQIAFVSYRLVSPDAETEIREVLARQEADWNRGDVEAFMRGYDNREDISFIGSAVARGFGPVLERYKAGYPTKESMGGLRFAVAEVRMLGANHASVNGRFYLTRTKEAGGNAHGIYSLLFRKTPEGWRVIQDHTSPLN